MNMMMASVLAVVVIVAVITALCLLLGKCVKNEHDRCILIGALAIAAAILIGCFMLAQAID